MLKPLKCRVGLHVWHLYHDQSVEVLNQTQIECTRCGKRSSTSGNVAARIGWAGHTDA
jgi:hypothetical protein